jgi:hypothetical protein
MSDEAPDDVSGCATAAASTSATVLSAVFIMGVACGRWCNAERAEAVQGVEVGLQAPTRTLCGLPAGLRCDSAYARRAA